MIRRLPTSPALCSLAAAALGASLPARTASADITAYAVGRQLSYSQTSPAQPTAPEYWALIAVAVSDTGGEIQAAALGLDAPDPAIYPMSESLPTLWQFNSPIFTDEASFLAAFPETTYAVSADRGQGPESGEVHLPEDRYCAAIPYMTGDTFTRLQNIDPSLAFDGTINGYTLAPGTNEGATSIVIAQEGTPGAVYSVSLDPAETAFQIPAGLLLPATNYSIGITYLNWTRTDNAGFGGLATSGAEYYRATSALFTTQNPPAPCSPTWLQISPEGPTPARRYGGSMVYDSARDRTVMFGGGFSPGSGATCNAETWEFDGLTWALRATTGPSPRAVCPLVYDSLRGRTVLIGGWCSTSVRDTWEWDGSVWSLRSTGGPSLRTFAAAAYDSARGKTVYFGGYQPLPAQWMNDTWEWDGLTWTQRLIPGPPARYNHQMVFDAARGRIVLFGGNRESPSSRFGDTWEYDGVSWTQVSAGLPAVAGDPPLRAGHAMTYDSARGRVLLFGGIDYSPTVLFGDTWEFDGSAWSPVSSLGPSARVNPGIAFDAARSRVVLFGGSEAFPTGAVADTWLRTAEVWITAGPEASAVTAGDSTAFEVTALSASGGGQPITYQWRKDGVPIADGPTGTGSTISGATTSTLTIQSATEPDEGAYDCLVSNTCGPDAASSPAVLTVETPALCPADFNQSGSVTVQDIFDFLGAYFSGEPAADFNGVGGVTVQDIFDFLAAYFTACP